MLKLPAALYAALVLAFVVALPSVWSGFFADDEAHLAIVEGMPAPGAPYDLFRFADGHPEHLQPFIQRGPYPWWTNPYVKLWFFRPLSSALFQADHAVFGRWAPGYHLHSIAWYLLFVLGAALLYRRAFGGVIAAIAMLLFAVDSNHAMVAGWIANRNAVVAAAPALFGLLAHLRWREEGWKPGLPLSLLGFAVGLTGGETAIAILAYLFAYEAVGASGTLYRRVVALAPALLLGVLYVIVYKAGGFGAWGSAIYIDPTRSPGPFLANAPVRYLALSGAGLLHSPAELWLVIPKTRAALVIVGALALGAAVFATRRSLPAADEQTRRSLKWLLLGSALSLLPVLATFPANRLLFVPSIGACALFAVLLAHARGAAKAVAIVFLVSLLLPALISWTGQPYIVAVTGEAGRAATEAAEIDDATAGNTQFVVLNAPDPLVSLYHPIIRATNGHPLPKTWQVMSMAPVDLRLTRTGERSFEFEPVNGKLLDTVFEQLVRSEAQALRAGQPIALMGLSVTPVEMDGFFPRRVRVEFDAPLEDSRYQFLHWQRGALRKWPLPKVGETVVLVHERGPAEL